MKSAVQFVNFFQERYQKSKQDWEKVYQHLREISKQDPDNKVFIKEFKKATFNLIKLNHQQYYEELSLFAGYSAYNLVIGADFSFYSLFSNGNQKAIFKTQIDSLDDLLDGGLKPGTLTMFGAPTNSGKTNFLINLGANFLRQNLKVCHIILESTPEYMIIRYAANLSKIKNRDLFTNQKMISKTLKKYEKNFVLSNEALRNLNINIDQVILIIRNIYKDFKFDALLLDYTQLILGTDSTQPYLYEIHEKIKMITQEFRCVTVSPFQIFSVFKEEILSNPAQLNLSLDKKVGGILNNADNVFLFHPRENYHTVDFYINKVNGKIRRDRLVLHAEPDFAYYGDLR